MVRVLLTLLALFIGAVFAQKSIVETPYGRIEGFEHRISDGSKADVFLGVQFATAERFEMPERVSHWNGIKSATSYGPSCARRKLHSAPRENETFSEECLHMNIFTPKARADRKGHPVLVFIFGGLFERGSPNYYSDFDEISENFVRQGIIFIAINHRLAAFGFFSTGDDVLPGNLGLWDQKSALEFIREVIPSFGGDIDRITVSGLSSGSASVSALTISPHTNNLFHQAIHFSGSIFSQFALYERVVNESFTLATQMGCEGASNDIKSCLKLRSVEEFTKAYEEIGLVKDRLLERRFYPRLDGVFFPSSFEKMLQSAPAKPTLAGLTTAEAGDWTMSNKQTIVSIPVEKRANFGREDLQQFIDLFCDGIAGLCAEMTEFYEAREEGDSAFYLTKLTQLVSDIAYVIPVIKEMSLKINLNWPVFLYLQEYYPQNEERENVPIAGAFHSNEIDFLFGAVYRPKFEFNEDDKHFQRSFLGAVTSFVKAGQPQVDSLHWEPATRAHPTRNLRFGLKNSLSDEYFPKETEFWLKRLSPTARGALFPWEAHKHPIAETQSRIDL